MRTRWSVLTSVIPATLNNDSKRCSHLRVSLNSFADFDRNGSSGPTLSRSRGKRTGLGAYPAVFAGALTLINQERFRTPALSPEVAPASVLAFDALANRDVDCLGRKTNRSWTSSSPGFGRQVFHPGFAPQALIPAGRSEKRRVCKKYAKNLQLAPN